MIDAYRDYIEGAIAIFVVALVGYCLAQWLM